MITVSSFNYFRIIEIQFFVQVLLLDRVRHVHPRGRPEGLPSDFQAVDGVQNRPRSHDRRRPRKARVGEKDSGWEARRTQGTSRSSRFQGQLDEGIDCSMFGTKKRLKKPNVSYINLVLMHIGVWPYKTKFKRRLFWLKVWMSKFVNLTFNQTELRSSIRQILLTMW